MPLLRPDKVDADCWNAYLEALVAGLGGDDEAAKRLAVGTLRLSLMPGVGPYGHIRRHLKNGLEYHIMSRETLHGIGAALAQKKDRPP